ncbi:uncharacterized protein LOC131285692 [Anopheles ziemanni]|uniref:uncharacterized protein LOC131259881 n=1 Tax=Anopheles coustani TaxID=139045 RepID=UPI00265B5026|nr:uncharacterized protein LOC131259881 [Anopheles coustani]XP_058170531.1 uncharacterized protein LOC131285692 [Anopheles ziemanni]
MEYYCIESDEEKFDVASEHDSTEDPLINDNTLDTSANAAISRRTSMRQQTSSKMRAKGVAKKTIKSAQSISSVAGNTSQNIILLLRCNYCSLLYQNETILMKHEKQCQQMFERRNSVNRILATDLEDWRRRLPQVTVGVVTNKEKVTTSCSEDISLTTQPSQSKFTCATPVVSKVTSLTKLEAPRSAAVSTSEPDPLAIDTYPVQPTSNSIISTTPVAKKTVISLAELDAPSSPEISSCNSPDPLVFDTVPVQASSYSIPSVSVPSASVPLVISSPVSCPASSLPPDVVANVAYRLARIENEITMLSRENCKLRESLQMSIDRPITTEENWEKINTHSQLEEFEAKLGTDTLFAGRMFARLKRETANCKPRATIARSLDFLISRQLLTRCSWTGAKKQVQKIPFRSLTRIQTLLQRVVGRQVPTDVVKEMVRKTLSLARQRLQQNPELRGSCHQKTGGRSPNNTALKRIRQTKSDTGALLMMAEQESTFV